MNLKRRDQRSAGPWLAAACALAFALLPVRHGDAAIVVDPLTTGATDVSFGSSSFSPIYPVTNPVPDPLNSPPNEGLLAVGRNGAGSLQIAGGSQANIRQIWMGVEDNSSGLLHLDGVGSKLTMVYGISIGLRGAGELRLTNGAVIEAEGVVVQAGIYGEPSQLMMSGIGTKLILTNGLSAGAAANATVVTTNGALIETNSIYLGSSYELTGAATATVSHGGKWQLSGQLEVGPFANGQLTIASGGEVSAGKVYLGNHDVGDPAAVMLDAGTLRGQTIYLGANGLAGNGIVHVNGLVSDRALVFDTTHGVIQTLPIAGQPNVSLQIDQQATGVLGAGYVGVGTLTIADGKQIESAAGQLGYAVGSQGTATVTGASSKWQIQGDLEVGVQGAGVLNIDSGATVDVGGSLKMGAGNSHVMFSGGQMKVDVLAASPHQLLGQGTIQTNGIHMDANLVFDEPGPLSGGITLNESPGQNIDVSFAQPVLSVLGAGYRGVGKIEIRNGAQVKSAAGILGQEAQSRGDAVVDGAGSKWEIEGGELQIGGFYTQPIGSSLVVRNGGKVQAPYTRVGERSRIEVAGADSDFITGGVSSFTSPSVGTTLLHVHSGGTADVGYVSTYRDALHRIMVEGVGSRLRMGSASLTGLLLTVRDGARFEVGASWNTSVFRAREGIIILDGGTIDLGGSAIELTGGFQESPGQFLFQDGVLQNFKRYQGDLWQFAGRVEPMQVFATIEGSYALESDATLALEIAQNYGQERLRVTDQAVLAGELEVKLSTDGPIAQLAVGNFYSLIRTDDGLIGEFESYSLPQLPTGMFWSFDQSDRDLNLGIVAGDFNSDGVVDSADYTVWRDSLGRNVAAGTGADADRSGRVTMSDYQYWKDYFGRKTIVPSANIAGQAANSLAVPEPASVFVLLSGLVAAAAALRRR